MEYSPTFINDEVSSAVGSITCTMVITQDAQCTAEQIALVLLPENTFGTVDYFYQLRYHLQRIMKQKLV